MTESQSAWVWKGPVEVMLSNVPAQAGFPRSGYPETCPDCFWTSPKRETTASLFFYYLDYFEEQIEDVLWS